MDENSRRRRQNDAPQYPGSDPRYGQDQSLGRGGYGGGSGDRYRPAPINTSPSASRSIAAPSSTYGYYQDPAAPSFPAAIPANAMQYQPEYAADQRQQQNYTSYNPNLMYGVNQPATQAAVYDNTQQFQTRQPAGMQMLSEVAAPYYAGEPTNTAGAPVLHQHASSSSSAVYTPNPSDRNAMIQGYPANISMSGMSQTVPEPMEEEEYAGSRSLDEAYSVYQDALKQIFMNIRDGRLTEASISMLEVSDWLLTNVVRLGLTGDDESLHSDRVKLWNEFNTAWLAILQKQKDMTQEAMQTGVSPRLPQSLISQDFLWKMSKELVRLCDGVEKHGLVDYQLGVWEENIMDILLECLDLLEGEEGGAGPSNPSLGGGRAPP